MKNQDGIELKVGQVWQMKGSGTEPVRIIHFDDGDVIYRFQDSTPCRKPDSDVFGILISDPDQPWLPLPEGYRLVTDKEREAHLVPDVALYFSSQIH